VDTQAILTALETKLESTNQAIAVLRGTAKRGSSNPTTATKAGVYLLPLARESVLR
jgi:hypothetical protein